MSGVVEEKAFNKLTGKQVIEVNDILREVVEVVDGGCRYKDGHSDKAVAEKLGVGVNSVANLRRQVYGNFAPAEDKPKTRREQLEARVAQLEDKMNLVMASLHMRSSMQTGTLFSNNGGGANE